MEGASKDLTDAIAALDSSKTELAEAEASLAQAESRLSEAKELDSQRAAELKAAETKAEKAQADVAAAQAAYDSVDARTSEEITVITQQSGALAELSVLFNDVGTGNIKSEGTARRHTVQLQRPGTGRADRTPVPPGHSQERG